MDTDSRQSKNEGCDSDDLRERLFMQYARATIDCVGSELDGEGVPKPPASQNEEVRENERKWQSFYNLVFPIVHRSESNLTTSSIISEMVQAHIQQLRDPGNLLNEQAACLKTNPADERALNFFLGDYFSRPIAFAMAESQSTRPPIETVREAYLKFRNSWESETEMWTATVPLFGLFSIMCPHEIVDGWQIRGSLPEDEIRIWGDKDPETELGWNTLSGSRYCKSVLVRQFEASKISLDADRKFPDDVANAVLRIVSAVRLRIEGDIGAGPLFLQRSNRRIYRSRVANYIWQTPATEVNHGHRTGSIDHTNSKAISDCAATFMLKGNRTPWDELRIPIERFNLSYGKSHAEDAFLDCVIGLESALLRDAQRSDLAYRFAMRGAAILRMKATPEATYDFLNRVYKARSAIVHSGKRLSDLKAVKSSDDAKSFAQRALSTLHDVIEVASERIAKGESLKQLCKSLDRDILHGLDTDRPKPKRND